MAGEERVLILGAAGRDYHTFNVLYRDGGPRSSDTVVGFTHAQIPHIESARYPASLAGAKRYPDGLPIWPEAELERVVAEEHVTRCLLAYSDISYSHVMNLAARARAAGAAFELLPPDAGMLALNKPVVAVTATRTGCGKSQVCALVIEAARAAGLSIVLVRHPMPYGDLASQAVQRFATGAYRWGVCLAGSRLTKRSNHKDSLSSLSLIPPPQITNNKQPTTSTCTAPPSRSARSTSSTSITASSCMRA
jgi:predicted GTPase